MRVFLKIALLSLLGLFLLGCDKKAAEEKAKRQQETIVTAKVETPVTPLYFNTTLAPLSTIPVLSTIDGRVAKLFFSYGGAVKKDQNLILVDSAELSEQFRKSVNDYLQRKDSYENKTESFQGTMALYRANVIPKSEFLTARSGYQNDILNFYQARFELEKILKKAQVSLGKIEQLKLSDTDEVNKILQRRFSDIAIKSSGAGVALFPIAGSGGGDSDSSSGGGKLSVGSKIKTGQLILSIGDLSGFSAKVQVSEINVNRIKAGMPIKVVGDAFPRETLVGKVLSVASQAQPSQGGSSGLSMFDVAVRIPTLTEQQQKTIHVGMSAKVQIDIKEKSRVMLPIAAVTEKGGKPTVMVVTKSGERKEVAVVTGNTTPTKVGIIEGLKEGDKVVVP